MIAFALLVALTGVGAVAPAASAAPDTVGLTQNGECHEVAPYGNGSQNVTEFYDYRTDGYEYASYGTTHLQRHQVSQLFLYNGSEGLSLVVLHDQLGDEEEGGTITFDLYGVPTDAEWAVQDDSYGDKTDDDWELNGSDHHIDWKWAPNRTDGGALRGMSGEFSEFTIKPGFNEDADHYDNWTWGHNETTNWTLRTSNNSETNLSMTNNVTVSPACAGEPPNASLSAPGTAEVGQEVTLNASNSSDVYGVAEYRWDVDSDGTEEAVTSEATYQHTYESTGNYTANVTVVDDAGQTDSATATIDVSDTTAPGVVVDAPTNATTNETITLSGANSSDNGQIASYEWTFGDGANATGETVNHTYTENGTYEVTLTVTDEEGNAANETVTVEVSDAPATPPEVSIDGPSSVKKGHEATFTASASDEGSIESYEWDLGDGTTATGESVTHAYDATGDYNVTVTVTDDDGQQATARWTVSVGVPPTVNIEAPDTAEVDESVTFFADASDDAKIVSKKWDFGDGSTREGVKVDNAFPETGTYDVTITVTDEDGFQTSDVHTITIEKQSDDSSGSDGSDGSSGGDSTDDHTTDDGSADDGHTTTPSDDGGDSTTPSEDGGDTDVSSDDGDAADGNETADGNATDDRQRAASDVSVTSVTTQTTEDGVTVIVEVTNDGNETVTYTVPLELAGKVVDRKTVRVPASASKTVQFIPEFSEPGTYTAKVGNATEQFSVQTATDTPVSSPDDDSPTTTPSSSPIDDGTAPLGQPGFGLLGALIAISVAVLLRRRL